MEPSPNKSAPRKIPVDIRATAAIDGDIRVTPPDIHNLRRGVANEIAQLMNIHGFSALGAQPVQVGSCVVLKKSCKHSAVELTDGLKAIRDAAASCLTEYMSLFGITSIELPTEKRDVV